MGGSGGACGADRCIVPRHVRVVRGSYWPRRRRHTGQDIQATKIQNAPLDVIEHVIDDYALFRGERARRAAGGNDQPAPSVPASRVPGRKQSHRSTHDPTSLWRSPEQNTTTTEN